MLEQGRYLTTEPIVVPNHMPPHSDVIILFNAAAVNGKPCGVLFPIAIPHGSELWHLQQLYEPR